MVGIVNVGTHIPRYRLNGEIASQVWGRPFPKGERTVANYDEDSLTMAVQAVRNCLADKDAKMVDGLFFASTTAPYGEKQNSALIATAADLRKDIFTADFSGSLRCGTAALRCAIDAVKSNSARCVLVVASDCRLVPPGSDMELVLGDGAVALLIAEHGIGVSIDGVFSNSDEFLDVWRKGDDKFLQMEDSRFITVYGYGRLMKEGIQGLVEKYGVELERISKFVFYAPDLRTHGSLTRQLGFESEKCAGGELLTTVGNTGSASTFLSLIYALQNSAPGDTLVLVGYGSGSDAFLLTCTKEVKTLSKKIGLEAQIASKRLLTNYGKYLRFRQLVETERIAPFSSSIQLWREQWSNLRLYGQICRQCESVQYPTRRVCWKCGAKDDFENKKLSSRGNVFTFAKDWLFPTPDPPTVMVTVDLDGGGRFYSQLTDCDPSKTSIGMPVEFTFRKLHEGGGFNNYFWKFRSLAS